MGNTDPASRSGRAIQAQTLNALKSTAHFGDNFQRSVNYEGRIENDLLFPIYGQRPGRKVSTYSAQRKSEMVTIGQPMQAQQPQMGGQPGQPPPPMPVGPNGVPPEVSAVLTKDASFNVTIKVTKNYNTLKEQEASTVHGGDQSSAPEFMLPLMGDLLFKYQDGPGHDELADRAKFGLRPDVQASLNGNQGQTPEMMQLQQENAALKQAIQAKTPEIQAKLQIAQMQEAGEAAQAQLKSQTSITQSEIAANASMANAQAKVDAENFRSYVEASERKVAQMLDMHLEKVTQALQTAHERQMHAHDQAHEAGMSAMEHAQALAQGQQQMDAQSQLANQQAGHQSNLAAQQAGHQSDLAVTQAALQPAPDETPTGA